MYEYVYQRLISVRKRLKRQGSTLFTKNVCNLYMCSKHIYIYMFYLGSTETVSLLTSALLLNPEVLTFWNMRRELILDGYLKPNDELQFSAVVLTFKPKCAEIFSYRRWIFFNILKGKLIWVVIKLLHLTIQMINDIN